MATLRLIYRARTPLPPSKAALSLFKSGNLDHVYIPSRGIPFSLLFHVILLSVLFVFRVQHLPLWQIAAQKHVDTIQPNEPRVVMFLPILGSGSPSMILPERSLSNLPAKPSVAAAPSKKGLVYPGPQPILSDPLKPTNKIQTLLQPGRENLPILAPPLTLPNFVQLADHLIAPALELPKPPPPPKPVPIKPPPEATRQEEPPPPNLLDLLIAKAAQSPVDLPPVKVAPPNIIDEAKLVLPPLPQMPEPKPPEPPAKEEPPVPEPPSAEIPAKKTPPPKETRSSEPSEAREALAKTESSPAKVEKPKGAGATEPSPLDSHGPDVMDMLALSPTPAPVKLPVQVPLGEARGRFAISPEPNLLTSDSEPGSKIETSPSRIGVGGQTGEAAGKEIPEKSVPDVSMGVSSGTAKGKDSKSAEATSNAASGSKAGTATGTGAGSGTGSGSGPGTTKKPFSGITIVGGSYDPGAAPNPTPVVQAPKPLQTSYGVTVISTENSGGGLPFVGVFSNEQIYTVYLDMRNAESDPAPSWTLEFAVIRNPAGSAAESGNPGKSQEGLILPFPIVKEPPALPKEVVRKYIRKMVIVYAVINVEGKMEQISVKESPDILLNEPLVRALGKWVFRPAQLHGQPVSVKTLLGIPLWVSE
jgi:hypothetical protein